ncbi:DNA methyltransferase [Mycobacterium phage Omega]|uniref:DNA (cytosine-5-)-methyltransferase n=1 Tax=Mycobacterium phage Omega TaxID=2907835 RepID=Q854E0_BPMOM|nr:DNA methyltransferase [Mycobacterium phage Omega]AAN12768.1 hypothetical protein PBI_OMEGA_128 [Mycobacterium phage Omega]
MVSELAARMTTKHRRDTSLLIYPVALRGRKDGAELEWDEAGRPAYAIRTGSGGSSKPMVCVTGSRAHALASEGADASEDGTERGTPIVTAFHENSRAELRLTDVAGNLSTGGGKPGQGYAAIMDQYGVRRLTPLECERLQGYPDGYTDRQSDAQRYRQLGNSVAIPCVQWIVNRLVAFDQKESE